MLPEVRTAGRLLHPLYFVRWGESPSKAPEEGRLSEAPPILLMEEGVVALRAPGSPHCGPAPTFPLLRKVVGVALQGSRGRSPFRAGFASDAMRLRPPTAKLRLPTNTISNNKKGPLARSLSVIGGGGSRTPVLTAHPSTSTGLDPADWSQLDLTAGQFSSNPG